MPREAPGQRPTHHSCPRGANRHPRHPSSRAVEVGFEPTEGLPLHTLSRRAPSATRRLHRRRAYPTRATRRLARQISSGSAALSRRPRGLLAAAGEERAQQRRTLVLEHAADHLDAVREPPVAQHIPQRARGARRGIGGAGDQPVHTGGAPAPPRPPPHPPAPPPPPPWDRRRRRPAGPHGRRSWPPRTSCTVPA